MNHYQEDPDRDWGRLILHLKSQFKKTPDLNAVLFLIGVQELGQGLRPYSKEEKQDLMHIAICKVLSYSGYYELEGQDEEGWPLWKSVQKVPRLDLAAQEKFLKWHVIDYFREELGWE